MTSLSLQNHVHESPLHGGYYPQLREITGVCFLTYVATCGDLFLLPAPRIYHDLKRFSLSQQNHKQQTALVLAEVFLQHRKSSARFKTIIYIFHKEGMECQSVIRAGGEPLKACDKEREAQEKNAKEIPGGIGMFLGSWLKARC